MLIGTTLALDAALAEHIVQVGLPHMAFSLLLMLGMTWVTLRIGEKEARYAQTASALLGTGIVLTRLEIPVLIGLGTLPQKPEQLTPGQSLSLLLALLFLAWEIAVAGNILRHALELPLRLGVLIAVAFFAIDQVVGGLLFERAAS